MLPLLIDLTGKKVLVFGGGEVGLRKARYFAKEAQVVAISREFDDGFEGESVRLIRCEVSKGIHDWIGWADYVVAATDSPDVNDQVCSAAASLGKQYNRADGVGSFLIPSVVDRGNFIVAISTLGKSPAASRKLREQVDAMLPKDWSSMVELQEELREEAKRSLHDQKAREAFLRSVLEDAEVWEALRSDPAAARRLALKKLDGGG